MGASKLTVKDGRTGSTYEIPVEEGAVRASDLHSIKAGDADPGLLVYDPALAATASCRSAVTYLNGEQGVLAYRGYPIQQLAERSSFLEVAYLLLHGDLPKKAELDAFAKDVVEHTLVHESIRKFLDGFHYDAHPMGMLLSTVAALTTFYPDARDVESAASRRLQAVRLIAKMPTIAAWAYRHSMGFHYVYPDNGRSYAGNFLTMMKRMTEAPYEPHPALVRALDVLFILHADHEQNCSTNAVRAVGSSRVDPYAAIAAGIAALWGPLHGGANEAVIRMLGRIGRRENIPAFLERVHAGQERLMGFGHRVYKTYDPRAKIIKRMADEVFAVSGRDPMLEIALELERIALEDDYFVGRHLYPNVDFYSGLIYRALGIPTDMFPVMFAIPRTVGWLAQWEEGLLDKEQRITRPRQLYAGAAHRDYLPIGER